MAISLYPHNQQAYDAVVTMLNDTGRACIIHPTGTGKSFVAFKYCEDNPDKTVLWLSPSLYIFKTQCEGLLSTDAEIPGNITFMTYAKLSLCTPEELNSLRPDVVILDEMHRGAARTWEIPVQILLSREPKPTVIGLTATSIRYLDGQKDTTQTFQLPVASEMTLGEAIVRGILPAPKYILSIFKYKDDLAKYELRARRAKSKAVRDAAEEILEKLRRALDRAEGLDLLFEKHMEDRHGKYLVFCANAEHMRDMMTHVPEWFFRVDPQPHVYSAYSEDPSTDRSFAAFKADESDHLKLLFCIDMLNEGIHVDDVSGVILLRPTVSPIVYKQQVGRALSANKTTEPIIFDIVLNIENLYSISSIQKEMETAVNYYRDHGDGDTIIRDYFEVIDEVHDCLELFDRLNETLTASWDIMYEQAKQYYEENGDLLVPKRYVTDEGYSLGIWLGVQRRVRNGMVSGILTPTQIRLLDEIGMRWESYSESSWDRHYSALREYYRDHGDLLIPAKYRTPKGMKLGHWLSELRTSRRTGANCSFLTPERIQALNEIGMVWDFQERSFEKFYAAALRYYREYGNLHVPREYVAPDGVNLGFWLGQLCKLRSKNDLTLSDEQIARLDALGMQWGNRYELAWDAALEELEQYYRVHRSFDFPRDYQTESGLYLGRWLYRQQKAQRDGTLRQDRKDRLDAVTPAWNPESQLSSESLPLKGKVSTSSQTG